MWKVLGGSATGKLHVQVGKGCEDSFGWFAHDTLVCLVIADGAGSRSHSALGSRAAVDGACHAVRDHWAAGDAGRPHDLVEPFERARQAIDALAMSQQRAVADFATTMAVAILTGTTLDVGQVGDSIVVARHTNGTLEAIGPSPRGEYINETVFVTSEDWLANLRQVSLPIGDIDAVALSTDGLQYKILEDVRAGTPYEPFFEDIFAYVASPEAIDTALVEFLDRLDDQTGDDKTLLLAVRAAEAGPSG